MLDKLVSLNVVDTPNLFYEEVTRFGKSTVMKNMKWKCEDTAMSGCASMDVKMKLFP